MRKSAKALLLALVALVGSLGLTIAAAFSAALAFGATALIVPGTGTHNVLTDQRYRDYAADRFINPAAGIPIPGGPACTSTDGCAINGVDYPAEFFPFVIFDGWCPGLQCDTWNQSVNTGVANLNAAIITQRANPTPNNEDLILFGYSQGGAVVAREMYNLAGLTDEQKSHITVVTIGNINNPRGLFARLGFLPTIPGLDITFGPNLPTDIGIKSVNYSFEYDPVGDAPSYWGNPFAMLNAIAAFEYVHGYYLVPNDRGEDAVMPYGYTDATLAAAIANPANRQTYQDATFVLIPQQGPLPIFQPFIDLGSQLGLSPIVTPLVALANPLTKLLVNLGYDRATNPGIPQYLSILPFNLSTFNPFTFSVQVVQAIVQGVQDAIGSLSPDSQAPEMAALQSFSRLAADTLDDATVTEETPEMSALSAETGEGVGDADAAAAAKVQEAADAEAAAAAAKAADDAAAAAKAAEEAAAAKAAEEAAAAEAAAKEAAEKAAKDAADAAEKAAKDAADAAEKAAKDAEKDPAQEAADKIKQEAADNAKEAGAGDADKTETTTDAPAAAGDAEGSEAA